MAGVCGDDRRHPGPPAARHHAGLQPVRAGSALDGHRRRTDPAPRREAREQRTITCARYRSGSSSGCCWSSCAASGPIPRPCPSPPIAPRRRVRAARVPRARAGHLDPTGVDVAPGRHPAGTRRRPVGECGHAPGPRPDERTLGSVAAVVAALAACTLTAATALDLLLYAMRQEQAESQLQQQLVSLRDIAREGVEQLHEVKGTIAGIASATDLIRHEHRLSIQHRERLEEMLPARPPGSSASCTPTPTTAARDRPQRRHRADRDGPPGPGPAHRLDAPGVPGPGRRRRAGRSREHPPPERDRARARRPGTDLHPRARRRPPTRRRGLRPGSSARHSRPDLRVGLPPVRLGRSRRRAGVLLADFWASTGATSGSTPTTSAGQPSSSS